MHKTFYLALVTVFISWSSHLAAQPVRNPDNGHWYEFVSSTLDWSSAEAAAAGREHDGMPGYLGSITSAEETAFVASIYPGSDAWIGFVQYDNSDEPSGNWEWVSGEATGYTNWDSGEPNNSGGEDCAELWTSGVYWNDINCSSTNGWYLVEYDPAPPPIVVPTQPRWMLTASAIVLCLLALVVLRRRNAWS